MNKRVRWFGRWAAAMLCALSLSGASCGPARPARAPGASALKFDVHRTKLANGLQLLAHRDASQGLVTAVLVLRVGGGYDPAGKEGLAHLVEHLVFRGKHGELEVEQRLGQLGAQYNGWTSADETAYYATVPAVNGAALIELFRGIASAPLEGVEQAAFDAERNIVENERRLRSENGYPSEVFARLDKALYGDSFYGKPTAGTGPSLQSLTLDDARAFVQAYYRPQRMTVLVAGELTNADDKLASDFGALSGDGPAPAEKPPQAPPVAVAAKTPIERTQAVVGVPELWLAWRLPSAWDDDRAALEVLETLANSSLGGLASTRSDVGSAEAFIERGPVVSTLYCRAVLSSTDSVDAVRSAIAHAIDQGTADRVLDRDWRIIYTRNESTHQLLGFEPLGARALSMVLGAHYTGDAAFMLQQTAAIAELSAEGINGLADRFLTLEQSRALLVEPGTSGATADLLDAHAAHKVAHGLDNLDAVVAATRKDAGNIESKVLGNGIQVYALPRAGDRFFTALLGFLDGAARKPRGVAEAADWSIASFIGKPPAGVATYRYTNADAVRWLARSNVSALDLGLEQLAHLLSHYEIRWKPDSFVEWLKVADKAETPAQKLAREVWSKLGKELLVAEPLAREIDAIAVNEIRKWRDAVYRPENAALVIVGPSAEQAFAIAEEQLGSWKRRPAREPAVKPAIAAAPAPGPLKLALLPRPDLSQTTLMFGCRLPAHSPQNAAEQDVLAALVGAELREKLRYQTGGTYHVSTDIDRLRDGTTLFSVSTSVGSRHLEQAVALILGWSERSDLTISQQALTDARFSVLDGFAMGRTTVALASDLFEYHRLGWQVSELSHYPEWALRASAAGVSKLVRACRQDAVLGAVGDSRRVEELAAPHLSFRP